MSPKEKAMELVWKYLPILIIKENPFDLAKQCALIAVDEIINNCLFEIYSCGFLTLETKHKEYWQEVKQEIEKL
jgi:hypothetical protein